MMMMMMVVVVVTMRTIGIRQVRRLNIMLYTKHLTNTIPLNPHDNTMLNIILHLTEGENDVQKALNNLTQAQ